MAPWPWNQHAVPVQCLLGCEGVKVLIVKRMVLQILQESNIENALEGVVVLIQWQLMFLGEGQLTPWHFSKCTMSWPVFGHVILLSWPDRMSGGTQLVPSLVNIPGCGQSLLLSFTLVDKFVGFFLNWCATVTSNLQRCRRTADWSAGSRSKCSGTPVGQTRLGRR